MAQRKPRARACPEAPKWTRGRGTVRWSAKVAGAILGRVAAGETLYAVCRDDGMPTPQSVARWAEARPEFGAALKAARRAGGGVWTYCEAAAREVFERLCEGESLNAIGADPTMPSVSTIFSWRRAFPDFAEAVRLGKEIQAEQACDLGWEMARDATPETAYLTHVRLTQLRWMAGVMAPKTYRIRAVEPEAPRKTLDVVMRRFEIEENPETGRREVVAYCPNPHTGEVEREDAPGWEPPARTVGMPGGWDLAGE